LKSKGGDILAETLKAYDVENIFGLPAAATTCYWWLQAEQRGIRTITNRSETGAAMMADGYARTSFKPGVNIFHNIGSMYYATGLIEAYHSSTPVIGITSTGGSRIFSDAGIHRETAYINFVSLFEEITKWTVIVDRVEKTYDILRHAFEVATTGRPGPVVVIFRDEDVFKEADVEVKGNPEFTRYPALRIGANSESISKAADLLIKAQRPVIYAGNGVMLSQAWNELIALAETLGAAVATTHGGKGAIPDTHPLCIGTGGSTTWTQEARERRVGDPEQRSTHVANKFLAEADVALFVGVDTDRSASMPPFVLFDFHGLDTKIIQIDVDSFEIGKGYPVEVGIVGDAKLSLEQLRKAVEMKMSKRKMGDSPVVDMIRKRMEEWLDAASPRMHSNAIPIKPARVLKELQAFIDKDTIVCLDASTPSRWGSGHLNSLAAGRTFLEPRGLGSLGLTVPMALGAKVGAPDKKVFCITGDGSFGYSIGELETAVRNNLNVIYIVLNNLSYSAEKRFMEVSLKRKSSTVDLSPLTNYGKVMEGLGGHGALVERPGEIKDAIKTALEANKPAVIDVRTEYQDTRPPWSSL